MQTGGEEAAFATDEPGPVTPRAPADVAALRWREGHAGDWVSLNVGPRTGRGVEDDQPGLREFWIARQRHPVAVRDGPRSIATGMPLQQPHFAHRALVEPVGQQLGGVRRPDG